MKLLASKTGLLTLVGIVLALLAVVLLALGQPRWGGAVLALTLIVVLGLLLVSHAFAVRADARTRHVIQRDLRSLKKEVDRTAGAIQKLDNDDLAGLGDSLRTVIERGAKPDPQEARRIRDGAKHSLRKQIAEASAGNTFGTIGALYGVGWEFEYGERARKAPGHFETVALRMKSLRMRDAFARSATNLQFDYAQMLNLVRAMRSGKARGLMPAVKEWDAKGLLATARVVANQRLRPSDSGDAILLFRLVYDVFGVEKLGRSDAYVFAEALSLERRHGEAARVFRETKMARRDPMQAQLLQLNAIHDSSLDDFERRTRWIEHLNALYAEEGLAPVRFTEPLGPTLLDSLTSDVAPRHVEGPRVSVLVPSFNGSEFIRTTLDSLVRQTWRDLEIIVVDDFSDQQHREKLIAICEEYEDVTLLLQPRNLGAYMARNRGLALATGEFVTVHDDDDWSHPQKIEIQVRHLLEHPEAAANMSRHARASEDLLLTRINNNPSFSQPNYSSLLARRSTIEQLGGWDTVNRGADAEFRDRLVKLTGSAVDVVGHVAQSFTRTHGASLTAGEIGRGYIDPARLFYQAAYFRALEKAEVTDGNLRMEDFARPLNMKPGMRGKHLGTYDVVFATDFRFPGGTTSLTINEVEFAAKQGLRVGMIQMDSPMNSTKDAISARALDVAQLENVDVLSLNDQADVKLLVVRHPTVLQFTESLSARLRVGVVVVVVNNPPILTGGRGVVFDLPIVRENAERLFGVAPDIAPESEVTRHLALTMVHSSVLAGYDWPGFIDTDRFAPPAAAERREVPVLGRHSRDATLKWPDTRGETLDVYGGDDELRVRILGGIGSRPSELQSELRRRADVLDYGEQTPEEFLQGLDFWAYFHSDALTESFGMATVEAMATGLVVFVPRYMRPNFNDGVVYAEAGQVRELVRSYWSDPDAYRAQSERARAVVMERYSAQAFTERLQRLVTRGAEALGGGEDHGAQA